MDYKPPCSPFSTTCCMSFHQLSQLQLKIFHNTSQWIIFIIYSRFDQYKQEIYFTVFYNSLSISCKVWSSSSPLWWGSKPPLQPLWSIQLAWNWNITYSSCIKQFFYFLVLETTVFIWILSTPIIKESAIPSQLCIILTITKIQEQSVCQ